jgi:NAD(P)-dependent dehydrogenase (short-subunit alcohol dehydrogenase family)
VSPRSPAVEVGTNSSCPLPHENVPQPAISLSRVRARFAVRCRAAPVAAIRFFALHAPERLRVQSQCRASRITIDTNLIAPFVAARLVLPVFRRQQAGTLINIGSVLSQVGQMFVPAYVVSKFGLRGVSDAVRADVADVPGISVSTVLPYAVDTPHFQEAANATGKRAHAMPPVQEPERVARAIVDVALTPRRQRYVPRYVVAGVALHWLWPAATERVLQHALRTFHLVGRQQATSGNLFSPANAAASVHGNRRPVIGRTLFAVWMAGAITTIGARWLYSTLAWPGQRSTR